MNKLIEHVKRAQTHEAWEERQRRWLNCEEEPVLPPLVATVSEALEYLNWAFQERCRVQQCEMPNGSYMNATGAALDIGHGQKVVVIREPIDSANSVSR